VNSLLEVSGVSVAFDGVRAINTLSFAIGPAELRALIGPNGAGKTSLLRALAGTHPRSGGKVVLGAANCPSCARRTWRARGWQLCRKGG